MGTAASEPTPIAFYAPMKAPDHPQPSGDRAIARLSLQALRLAGFAPHVASDLRIFDKTGDRQHQAKLMTNAEHEIDRLKTSFATAPPKLWFTYHSYHKAPDLIGPAIADAFDIGYAISEPSLSPKQRNGPWAVFATASEAALARADRLLWTTNRDRPALVDAGYADKLVHLPAFLSVAPAPEPRQAGDTLRLLTVAMMRPGDKLESYRRLAAAISTLSGEWCLDVIGDGEARADVERALAPVADRVVLHGAIDDPLVLQRHYEQADLFLWPGVGEGVGQVYLEAQAAGVPVIAEDHPSAADLVANDRAEPGSPVRLAKLIQSSAVQRQVLSAKARAHIEAHHSLDAAADVLRDALKPLLR